MNGGANSREGGTLASAYSNDLSGFFPPEHSSPAEIVGGQDPGRLRVCRPTGRGWWAGEVRRAVKEGDGLREHNVLHHFYRL